MLNTIIRKNHYWQLQQINSSRQNDLLVARASRINRNGGGKAIRKSIQHFIIHPSMYVMIIK